jgi:transcriptional regulator with XRE-family HTH domain
MARRSDGDYDGAKIVALRKAQTWSQAELARQSGLKQPSIWGLEHQLTKKPKADTLMRVANALGVPLREILRPSKRTTADLAEDLIELFNRLDASNKQAVMAAIRALLSSQK